MDDNDIIYFLKPKNTKNIFHAAALAPLISIRVSTTHRNNFYM